MTSLRIWRFATVGALLFFLLVVVWADSERLPPILRALYDYPGGDKVGHFGLYGWLAFLGAKAWRRPLRLGPLPLPAGALPAVLLAAFEELSQLFFPARSADWLDLGAGFSGIAVAVLLASAGPPY